MKLLKSPFENEFLSTIKQAKREIIVSTPYINNAGASILLNSIEPSNKSINILTNLSAQNIIDNVTQPSALLKIQSAFRQTIISSLAKLHAKVYIIDETIAVITSANLTYGGLKSNFEYGVLIDDTNKVKIIKQDVLDYATLGLVYDKELLEKIYEESQKVEKVYAKTEKQINNSELNLLLGQQQKINSILETRYENKDTRHGIFVKTVLFVMQKHAQLTIQELYELVKDIHPEMCDDTVTYHNEKRWKIEIRQALFYGKRKGNIVGKGKGHNHIGKFIQQN